VATMNLVLALAWTGFAAVDFSPSQFAGFVRALTTWLRARLLKGQRAESAR
jgi:hypothetical protein